MTTSDHGSETSERRAQQQPTGLSALWQRVRRRPGRRTRKLRLSEFVLAISGFAGGGYLNALTGGVQTGSELGWLFLTVFPAAAAASLALYFPLKQREGAAAASHIRTAFSEL